MTDTQNNQLIGERFFLFSAWWQLKSIYQREVQEAGSWYLQPIRIQALRISDCQRHRNSSSDGICIWWDSTRLTTTQSHVNKQTGTRLNTNKPTKTPPTLGNIEGRSEESADLIPWGQGRRVRLMSWAGEADLELLSRRSLEAGIRGSWLSRACGTCPQRPEVSAVQDHVKGLN